MHQNNEPRRVIFVPLPFYILGMIVVLNFYLDPGEFGNDTLCTDPAWYTALLAFKWLGLPYEVQHDDVRLSPIA